MSSNQGVQKDVSAATPESGTQTISQDRLALARTKTKAEINKVLLPAKATKRTSRLTSKTPKQQQFGNKKLKMSEYLYNDHLQALAATLTAQAHLYNKVNQMRVLSCILRVSHVVFRRSLTSGCSM